MTDVISPNVPYNSLTESYDRESLKYPQFADYLNQVNPIVPATDVSKPHQQHYVPPPALQSVHLPSDVAASANSNIIDSNTFADIKTRIAEIEKKLSSKFYFYKCWLWICLVLSFVSLIANIVYLAIPHEYDEVKDRLGPGLVGNTASIFGYYFGFAALSKKSYQRNQIFKAFLFGLIVFDAVMIGLLFGKGPEGREWTAPWSSLLVWAILSALIDLGLLVKAFTIGDLLDERKALMLRIGSTETDSL